MAKPADLLSVEDARERILRRFHRLDTETVPLQEALGRVLSEPVSAGLDLPPFKNSSMDGFAVVSTGTTEASSTAPVRLRVISHIAAGSWSDERVEEPTAARIMTGAPLPPGADAVVPFEEVADDGESIRLTSPISAGACVRPAGQDVRTGADAMEAGTEIGAPQLALLAALGHATVPVARRPVVAVMSTGDELVQPGQALRPGQIYNSNTPMIEAAVREAGGEPRVIETAADDPALIRAALLSAVDADLIVTTGGASVGDFDHMKDVVGASGEVAFWRVRVRPGKPLLFGSVEETPIIGLPGNPTSAMVTFELFVRPAIRTMLGASPLRPEIEAVVDAEMENRGGRRTYARVRLSIESGQFHATPAGAQDSAMLLPLARAHGLLEIREEVEQLYPGDRARVLLWRLDI